MNSSAKVALFFLRFSVFLVFLVWSVDKLVRPEHASLVFQNFYKLPSFGPLASYALGAGQILLSFTFLLGICKRYTYGAVFVLHLISTVSSYRQYWQPYENVNILFFAALPMLAACFALFVMRDQDTLLTLGK